MELFIAAYIALVASSGFCGHKFGKAYKSKLKRLGYVSTEPELYGEEANLQKNVNRIKSIICYLIPLLNLLPFFMVFWFESFSDSVINTGLRDGNLREVTPEELKDEPEEGYLQRRIEEVKKFQSEMGHKNIPRTYTELSCDERIAVLLHELQLAYEEKAERDGIDLTEVQPLLEEMPSNNAPKSLKKV